MALSLEDAINRRFEKVLDSKDAIISAITLPKFRLKWVESQAKKDHYTQMLIDEMDFMQRLMIPVKQKMSIAPRKKSQQEGLL